MNMVIISNLLIARKYGVYSTDSKESSVAGGGLDKYRGHKEDISPPEP